ncbi:MAG: protease inhibitor I42 family protein [Thermoleophilia bacterium]
MTRRKRQSGFAPTRRGALSLATLVVVAAGLVACGGSTGPAPAPTHVFLTEKDSSGELVADVGALVTVTLVENPSTGYAWTMWLGPGLRLLEEAYDQPSSSPSGPQLVGVAGARRWTVRVERAGTTTMKGAYARPWESVNAAAFSITVHAATPPAD